MFKLVSVQTANLTNNLVKNSSIIVRTLKNDLKIKWEPPAKVFAFGKERSGDLGRYEVPDPSNICLKYQYATELDNAEPNVRNQFTLGWHPAEYSREFYEKTLMDSVRSHRYDYKSPVAMIAQITGSIRFMQYEIENDIARTYRRRKFRREIKELMRARVQLINDLREKDYKQYEWLLERLDLQFKPKPQKEDEIMVTRKEGLRQLTNAYCDDLKNQKLDAYRIELEAQQLPFLEQKLKNLEFIRSEQEALRVDVTISKEQIEETRQKYEEKKKDYESKKVEPTKNKWKVY